jgi:hypothetical protein
MEVLKFFKHIEVHPMSFNIFKNPTGLARKGILVCLMAGLLWVIPPNASASNSDSDPDRQVLIDLTQNYFNAVGARDIDSLQKILLPKAHFIYRNGEEVDSTIGSTSSVRLLEILTSSKAELFERMHEPTVLIQGDIGIVWTRYDFYENKQFSHCGTDVFTFLKTKEGWKMASGSWSTEKKSCKAPPLGVPLK